jgi:cytochrome c-type biogenesis protein CcmF
VAAIATVFVALIAAIAMRRGPWLAPVGVALGVWVIAGAISEWATRIKLGNADREEVIRRARNLSRSAYGGMLAHAGVGVMVIGIISTSAWQTEDVKAMMPGETISVAGYDLKFRGVGPRKGPNYAETVGVFDITRTGKLGSIELEASKRIYDMPKQGTTEAGIVAAWTGDLYVVLGDDLKDGQWAVRVYFHPLVRWIWIGAVIMSLGGLLSLSDRRLRVGAPKRARATPGPVVPAE